jgi:nucleotide-binding universal stress UspA family protein
VLLVGVDGSPTSMRAAAYAAGLARRQRARLVAVFVAAPLSPLASHLPDGGAWDVQTQGELADELESEISAAADRTGVAIDFLVRHGDPFTELCRTADGLLADGVLVGVSEKGPHRFVGSLAVRLVRSGRWPVTVVP